jgi:hypothetical protein
VTTLETVKSQKSQYLTLPYAILITVFSDLLLDHRQGLGPGGRFLKCAVSDIPKRKGLCLPMALIWWRRQVSVLRADREETGICM